MMVVVSASLLLYRDIVVLLSASNRYDKACLHKQLSSARYSNMLVALASFTAVLAVSMQVQAVERQWHAGVDVGYAALSWDDSLRSGVGFGVHGAYGLTDSFNLMLEVGSSFHPVSEQSAWVTAINSGIGVGYTLDILSWVPYVGLLTGGYYFTGAEANHNTTTSDFRVGFQGALGMDYRPARTWALGIQARYHTFATGFMSEHYVTCFGRFEWTWGW